MVPEPYYTLINTSKGKDPAVVVVNSALRTFDARSLFLWHLRIGIACKVVGNNGMPTAEECQVLECLEGTISKPLQLQQNALFLARITCQRERSLLFRVQDPEIASELLQSLVSEASPLREWDYRMEHDPDWELAQPELRLLESDPRCN